VGNEEGASVVGVMKGAHVKGTGVGKSPPPCDSMEGIIVGL